VALSAGSKESSLRPSKPAPNTINGEPPAHEPRSSDTVPVAAAAEAAALAVGAEEAMLTAEAEHEEAVAAVAAPVAGVPLTDATAELISSAVTSGTRRFFVKMHPSGSF
jgi:hypothetical protein